MKKVLVVGQIHEAAQKILADYEDLEFEMLTDPGSAIPQDKIDSSDAILIRYGVLSEADLKNASRLKIVSRHGVGTDNLPVDALAERGIPVTVVGPVNAVSVAELIFAMLLSLARKVRQYDQAVRGGNWSIRDSLANSELAGKTLLLLGFGNIGREVAKRAQAFDMEVLVFDPYIPPVVIENAGASQILDWHEVLGRVDVLSLHIPLNEKTKYIINAEVLALIKPTAIVLNAARGGLIDEQALFEALSTRMAAGGAGIDTFETEPPKLDNPLLGLPNIVVSPHSAALTEEAAMAMGVVAARNVIAGLEGKLDPDLVVNLGALQRPMAS